MQVNRRILGLTKRFGTIGLISFTIIIFLLGHLVLRHQPAILSLPESPQTTPTPTRTETKNDLKSEKNLYGIVKDGWLLPETVDLPGGSFMMGSLDEGAASERPQHNVSIAPFAISRTEITNAQYLSFCQATNHPTPNDPHWQGIYIYDYPNNPVVAISWYDAQAYCQWLSKVLDQTVRLPREAEWEYAAQNSTPGTILENSHAEILPTTKVGSYPPNSYQLYDMLGNVWEWCSDWYAPDYYGQSPTDNPTGPTEGEYRVMRGGSWAESQQSSRITKRNKGLPTGGSPTIGFRVVITKK